VLVNNAAIAFKAADPTPFEGQTGPTLKTNFHGTVRLTEKLLPLLEKSPAGRIATVASMAGALGQVSAERQKEFTSPSLTTERLVALADEFAADVKAGVHKKRGWGNSNYGFSKLCVIAYTKVLARKYAGKPLLVNACCPGTDRRFLDARRRPHVGRTAQATAGRTWPPTRARGRPTRSS